MDCDNYIQKKGYLQPGSILETSKHGLLQCKHLYLASLLLWQRGASKEDELIKEIMFNVFDKCEKLNAETVSIAALG